MGGVKLAEGFNVTWVDPKEKIQYDEDGKPYYNSVESVAIIDKNGKFEKDSKDNIKHERKISRLYLEPGTVILDVGNSFGVDIIAKDVIRIDHHGEKNKKITSTTNELFNVVKENPKFIENFKENTGTSDFVWFENYINFVTKVDNLDYEVNPENWDNYNNTLYAGQKYFNSSNREIILDIFKNYPDIHFENFTQEEQDYIIAIGNKGQENNKKTGIKKISLKDLRPLRVDGKPFPPEFFEDHPLALYDSNIIKLRDLVELQKNAIRIANKVIKDNETVMYSNGLKTDSPVLGKVIIDEKDIQNKYNNPLGAVAAYGNGYDTYIILNLSGKRKNEVFVSTKKDATEFVDNLRTLFKETLGDAYTEETIIPVRDSMVVIRDPAVKSLDADVIRAIIAKALRIDGHSKEKVMEDLKKKIETLINTDKRKDHIDKIETMLNRYNLNLK